MKRKISKIAFLSILSIIMLMTFTAPTMLPGDNNKASAVRACDKLCRHHIREIRLHTGREKRSAQDSQYNTP